MVMFFCVLGTRFGGEKGKKMGNKIILLWKKKMLELYQHFIARAAKEATSNAPSG